MKFNFGGSLSYESIEFEEIMTFLAEKAGDPEIRVPFTVYPLVDSLEILEELDPAIASELEKFISERGGSKE
jgi:hypothetical protein